MATTTILSNDRKELLRRLARSNERLSWPAVYSSRQLSGEIRKERQLIVDKLRDLPLAG